MKSKKSELNHYKELAGKFIGNNRPLAMIYFVTKTCNCTCAHCFYWESLNKPRPNELTLEELDKITSSLGELLYLRLSGGEPFIRRDLFDLVSLFAKKCGPAYIGIPSNGYFTERMVEFAEQATKLDTRIEIGISIDDFGEYHDKIRGPKGLFEKALGTFKALQAVSKKTNNLKIGFITTAMHSNQQRLVELFQRLKALEPDAIACNIIRDDTKVKEEKNIDLGLCHQFSELCDDYNESMTQSRNDLFERLRKNKTDYAHTLRKKVVTENQFQIPCVAGNKIIVMYAEGEIHPCETLGYEIGSVRSFDYDINRLLQSDRAREIREKIIKEKCFCSHECFTSASIALSKKQMFKLGLSTLFSGRS